MTHVCLLILQISKMGDTPLLLRTHTLLIKYTYVHVFVPAFIYIILSLPT